MTTLTYRCRGRCHTAHFDTFAEAARFAHKVTTTRHARIVDIHEEPTR